MNIFWQRVCVYASPILLLVVFCTQVYHVRVNALNPWRGGGFAMFSTIDSPNQRVLRCYLVVGRKQVALAIPPRLARANAEARIIPTADRLTHLGTEMLSEIRRSFDVDPEKHPGIRVEVWRVGFDPANGEVTLSKLREASVEG